MTSDSDTKEIIPRTSLESCVSTALKLAGFRPSRYPLESDAICKEAAKAVVAAFERAQWQVIKTGAYPGWGPEGSGRLMGQAHKRCENCDD